MLLHKHHIIPRHAGGTNELGNFIYLTIPEHAEAHRLLWIRYGRLGDKCAWLMLSGKTEEGELLMRELASKANAGNKYALGHEHKQTPETRAKISKSMIGLVRSPETRAKISKTKMERSKVT